MQEGVRGWGLGVGAVGIDPGLTATGWALPDGRSGVLTSKLTGVARLDDLARQFLQLLDALDCDEPQGCPCCDSATLTHRERAEVSALPHGRLLIADTPNGLVASQVFVAIEGYSFGARNVAHQLGELGGVFRLAMWRERIPFVVVAPTMVKKFAGDRGNLKKDEMRLAVYKRWGKEFVTEHEVDAFVLARIADAILWDLGFGIGDSGEKGPKLTQPQMEIVQKLQNQIVSFENSLIPGGHDGHARRVRGGDAPARNDSSAGAGRSQPVV